MRTVETPGELERAFERWLIAALAHERARLAAPRPTTNTQDSATAVPPRWEIYLRPHEKDLS